MFLGADFSHHNEDPPIASQDFVILRAGYGKDNSDRKFVQNVEQCRLCGVPFGVYWFSYALSPDMARDEADFCINAVERTGRRPEYPIYFDFEYDSWHYYIRKTGHNFNNTLLVEYTKAFCQRVEERGYYAGIYGNKDYFKKYEPLEGRYTFWLADWSSKAPGDFSDYPSYVHMRQYKSTDIDLDVSRIDFPAVMRKAHLNGFTEDNR